MEKNSNAVNFIDDAAELAHWCKVAYSWQLKNERGVFRLDRSDAILLFRSQKADMIKAIPNSDKWNAFKLRDQYSYHRVRAQELSPRLYKKIRFARRLHS